MSSLSRRCSRSILHTVNFAAQLVIGALIVAAFDLRYLLVYLPYILGQRLGQPWPPVWPQLALPIGVTLAWLILAAVALIVSILHRQTACDAASSSPSAPQHPRVTALITLQRAVRGEAEYAAQLFPQHHHLSVPSSGSYAVKPITSTRSPTC